MLRCAPRRLYLPHALRFRRLPSSRLHHYSFSNTAAMSDAQAENAVPAEAAKPAEPELPKLSAHEFRQYNRLAEHMDIFVSTHFFWWLQGAQPHG